MRFALRKTSDRAAQAAAEETQGPEGEPADAREALPDVPDLPSVPDDTAYAEELANGALATTEATDALALYEEYLRELDKVPTLRDPVLPEASGQFNLDDRIREIVRDELAKLLAEDETPKRGSTRSRKRRKR